jgi:hypothetical protein
MGCGGINCQGFSLGFSMEVQLLLPDKEELSFDVHQPFSVCMSHS